MNCPATARRPTCSAGAGRSRHGARSGAGLRLWEHGPIGGEAGLGSPGQPWEAAPKPAHLARPTRGGAEARAVGAWPRRQAGFSKEPLAEMVRTEGRRPWSDCQPRALPFLSGMKHQKNRPPGEPSSFTRPGAGIRSAPTRTAPAHQSLIHETCREGGLKQNGAKRPAWARAPAREGSRESRSVPPRSTMSCIAA